MALRASFNLEKLKDAPRALKLVAAVVLCDLVIAGVALLTLDDQVAEMQARTAQLRSQLTRLHRQTADAKRQIEQYPALLLRYQAAVNKGILAPLDRMKVVANAQGQAERNAMTDLHYKIEIEESKADPKASLRPAASRITLEAKGVLDGEALAFWDEVLTALPNPYEVVEASLERTRDLDANALADLRAGRSPGLINAKLSLRAVSLQRPGAP